MKQGQFEKDWVVQELVRGNAMPALRQLAQTVLVGSPFLYLNKALRNSKSEYTEADAINAVGNGDMRTLLGYLDERNEELGGWGWLSSGIQGMEYHDTPVEKALSWGGPVAGEAIDIASLVSEYSKGKESGDMSKFKTKFIKEGTQRIPLVGGLAKGWVLPAVGGEDYAPYNPRQSKIWDSLEAGDVGGASSKNVARMSNSKDASRTDVAGKIANKINTLKKEEKDFGIDNSEQIASIERSAQQLGIDLGTAESYYKESKNASAEARKKFSKEEKAFYKKGKSWTLKYIKKNGKKLSDYPTLETYVNEYGW